MFPSVAFVGVCSLVTHHKWTKAPGAVQHGQYAHQKALVRVDPAPQRKIQTSISSPQVVIPVFSRSCVPRTGSLSRTLIHYILWLLTANISKWLFLQHTWFGYPPVPNIPPSPWRRTVVKGQGSSFSYSINVLKKQFHSITCFHHIFF